MSVWFGLFWVLGCGGDEPPTDPGDAPDTSVDDTATGDTSVETIDPTPPDEPSVEALLEAWDRRGLASGEGYLAFDAAANCCEFNTCLHINPGAEYGTYALPPGPGEYTADRQPREDGHILSWRLRQDEAIVYVGPPPPGTSYTSFRTYIHDVAGPGRRAMSFANLGDSLNHLVWGENADGTLVVVTTANAETLAKVSSALDWVGWPTVNVDGIPFGVPTMGLGQEADTYHTTLRLVGLDRSVVDPWLAAPTGRVFRLSPEEPLPPSALSLTSRPAEELAPVTEDLSALEAAIAAAYPEHDAEIVPLEVLQPPDDGSCWSGCNRDVSYRLHPEEVIDDEILMAYGVDPVGLGRATWTAVVLHGMDNSDSAGAFGSATLAGTAQSYLPSAPEHHYAVAFARSCEGVEHCIEIPDTCPGIGPEEEGQVVWRHYLDPVTGTFPPVGNLGMQGVIRLTPRAGAK